MTASSSGISRAVPYHCPYCADENLRPHGDKHGEWECRGCLRAFRLGFVGHLSPTHASTNTPSGRRHAP